MTADPELMAKLIMTLFARSIWDNLGEGEGPISNTHLHQAITKSLKEVLELVKKADE